MRHYIRPAEYPRRDEGGPSFRVVAFFLMAFGVVFAGALCEDRVSHNAARYSRSHVARYPRAGQREIEGVLCAGKDGDGDGFVVCHVYLASGQDRTLRCPYNIFWETDQGCVEGGFRPLDVGSEE